MYTYRYLISNICHLLGPHLPCRSPTWQGIKLSPGSEKQMLHRGAPSALDIWQSSRRTRRTRRTGGEGNWFATQWVGETANSRKKKTGISLRKMVVEWRDTRISWRKLLVEWIFEFKNMGISRDLTNNPWFFWQDIGILHDFTWSYILYKLGFSYGITPGFSYGISNGPWWQPWGAHGLDPWCGWCGYLELFILYIYIYVDKYIYILNIYIFIYIYIYI